MYIRRKTTSIFIFNISYSKKGVIRMNNTNNNNVQNNVDPNKKKKCNCEDKYGPKPFTTKNTSKPNSLKPN